ncbi:MAG TPA: hypothetical protein VFT41_02340 [Gemmatimonadaceae bacterium]|nr:hypothetical protein [Gemmatimonadaceae bacterium]
MPKSKPAAAPAAPASEPPASLIAVADALCRSATECCRQHDRVARIVERSDVEVEVTFAQEFCELIHQGLGKLLDEYDRASAADPGDGQGWRPRANALALAARGYLRRHNECDQAARKLQRHDSQLLATLAMEFEFEASALLTLRHATEAYRKERPEAA